LITDVARGDKTESGGAGKRIAFAIALFLCLAAFAETVSFGFFMCYGKARLKYHLKVDEEKFAEDIMAKPVDQLPAMNHDPTLGWDEPPVKTGAMRPFDIASRKTPYPSKSIRISTYGDSFTYCQDVKDNETWQYYLSELTGAMVVNYGARGYGPDQAVLKMEKNISSGRLTQITILGILSENIARVVNVNPKFYWADGDVNAFKPVLVRRGGVYEWKTKYLENLGTRSGRLAAVEAIKKYDFWYAYNKNRPTVSFPYSMSAIGVANYLLFHSIRWSDLWEHPRASATVRKVIDYFYSMAKNNGVYPVVLFIPEIIDLKLYESGEKSSYEKFATAIESSYDTSELMVIDIFDETFDPAKFNISPYAGHASAYGNRVIAQSIYRHLQTLHQQHGDGRR